MVRKDRGQTYTVPPIPPGPRHIRPQKNNLYMLLYNLYINFIVLLHRVLARDWTWLPFNDEQLLTLELKTIVDMLP